MFVSTGLEKVLRIGFEFFHTGDAAKIKRLAFILVRPRCRIGLDIHPANRINHIPLPHVDPETYLNYYWKSYSPKNRHVQAGVTVIRAMVTAAPSMPATSCTIRWKIRTQLAQSRLETGV